MAAVGIARQGGVEQERSEIGAETDPLIKGRMPDQIVAVAPMPDIDVMLKILAALA